MVHCCITKVTKWYNYIRFVKHSWLLLKISIAKSTSYSTSESTTKPPAFKTLWQSCNRVFFNYYMTKLVQGANELKLTNQIAAWLVQYSLSNGPGTTLNHILHLQKGNFHFNYKFLWGHYTVLKVNLFWLHSCQMHNIITKCKINEFVMIMI